MPRANKKRAVFIPNQHPLPEHYRINPPLPWGLHDIRPLPGSTIRRLLADRYCVAGEYTNGGIALESALGPFVVPGASVDVVLRGRVTGYKDLVKDVLVVHRGETLGRAIDSTTIRVDWRDADATPVNQ